MDVGYVVGLRDRPGAGPEGKRVIGQAFQEEQPVMPTGFGRDPVELRGLGFEYFGIGR